MNKSQMKPAVETSTLNQLMKIGKLAMQALDARLESVELSAPKLWALLWIEQAENALTITQLAECMSSAKSNITALVDRLEKEGLVRRVNHPEDRRIVLIEMTDAGRARHEEGMRLFHQLNQEMRLWLGEDGAAQTESCLQNLQKHLSS